MTMLTSQSTKEEQTGSELINGVGTNQSSPPYRLLQFLKITQRKNFKNVFCVTVPKYI